MNSGEGAMGHVEIRDPLHGPIAVSPGELRVIDAPHFQRLRRVKQLGFAEYVFPGAVHHRYLHSLGAMHLAGQVFDRLAESAPWLTQESRERLRCTVRLAALLHDIGHPPLSHAAESLLPDLAELKLPGKEGVGGRASHEDMTLKLILDSELTRELEAAFRHTGIHPQHVAALIDDDVPLEDSPFHIDGLDHRPALHAMVSGEMDVDRMDYLLRDSYFAGVEYGGYDQPWLASNALCVPEGDVVRLGIDVRALPAFEHFLLARYHMFQMVYFHPKSDIYDAMLKQWLASVGDEARFPGEIERYILCDDAHLMGRLQASDNPWAGGIVQQDPLRLVAELRGEDSERELEPLDADLAAQGIAGMWLAAKPVLSRYARAPEHLRTNPLLVRDGTLPGGAPRHRRIEEVTDLFGRYESTQRARRLYAPSEQRQEARDIVERWRVSAG
ncbi:MAG: HD domain-containing protein [Myxococcota bacterium]|nr:HD domain-containing protein [Myxococcota bacterium]